MKKFTSGLFVVFCSSVLVLAAFGTSSCKKDKTCHGQVKVIDTSGVPVVSAIVKLAAPSVNGDVIYSGITNAAGETDFEVKLPAIFDVTATKATFPPGYAGVGVLRLDEPGKTNAVTVTIR